MLRLVMIVLALALAALAARPPEPQWFKGNTHTHTLWSDGDGAPELVVDWYASRDYHFLALSDHNVLSQGEKWFPVTETGRLTPERVEELQARFGAEAVELREAEGGREMRLWNLPELRARFERQGSFVLVQGEEITTSFEGQPVHVNAVNLVELIPPRGGGSVREVMQANVDAVLEQERELGQPVLAHVNHPNFRWGISWQDLAHVRGERFFEVYNGHSGVRNEGDDEHPSTEEMWDLANTLRLTELDLPPLYGVATDDSHEYHRWGVGRINPGRGWVQVKARRLEAGELVQAMRAGDFYASSGVELERIEHQGARFAVHVVAEDGLEYTTRFIGTRRTEGGHGPPGEVLHETLENPAVYQVAGDELYVRATVVSSRLHPNPYREGDFETAWVQPIVP